MASYSINWKTSALRDLKKFEKQYVQQLLSAIELLAGNPFPAKCLKLHGSESLYRIRSGDYRIIYQVEDKAGSVTIYHIRHRKDAYRR